MSLHILQHRIDSFTKSRRIKSSSKTSNNLKWPHPSHYLATPEKLAEAGFYFDPSPGDKDSVTCYMCNKQLSEWAEEDDPYEIHFEKCGKKCGWASVRCGFVEDKDENDNFVFKDKNRLPNSKAMEKARLQTFAWENQWPHDQAGTSPNSKSMARAGFIYVPTGVGDDTVACMYCGILLSGWDKEDDPNEEHRRRVLSNKTPCPMFPDITMRSFKASTSKSKQKSTHMDVVMPTKDYDGQEEEEAPAQKSSSTSKTPRKPKSTARGAKTPARNRSTSRSRQVPVVEDEDDEDGGDSRGVTPAPPSKSQKKQATTHKRTRSRSKSVAPPQTDTDDDAVVPAPVRATRTRAKSKGIEEESDDQSSKTVRATRARAKSKGIGEAESDDQSSKTKHQRGRSKSQVRVSVIPEDDAAVGDEEESRPVRKAKGSSKAATSTRAETLDDDPPPRTRKTSKAPKPELKISQPETLGTSTSKKPSNHKRTVSSSSQKGKARALPLDVDSDGGLNVPMGDILPVTHLPPPAKDKTKGKSSTTASRSRDEKYIDLDVDMDDSADLDLVPPPSKTRPPLSRVASNASKTSSSTGSETTGMSRSKVKALASKYESEEPPLKSHKPQQTPHTTATAVRVPSHRSADSNPASQNSRSGSDRERREVDMELQLVEISSDEEDENGVRTPSPKKLKRKVKKVATQEEEKENKRGKAEQTREKERLETDDRPLLGKTVSMEKREGNIVEQGPVLTIKDVEMVDSQDHVEVQIPVGRPVTPPIVSMTPSFPPKTPFIPGMKGQTNVPPTPGVQFFPPLSNEPFVDLEILSNEEFDMTVEEWIRYQMNIEYQKFKKDGDNKLAAFQRRVDEVRRTIEAL